MNKGPDLNGEPNGNSDIPPSEGFYFILNQTCFLKFSLLSLIHQYPT